MIKATPRPTEIILPILIASLGAASMSVTAWALNNDMMPMWTISPHKVVNLTFTMQMIVLGISFVALGLTYLNNKEGFRVFFHFMPRIKSDWHLYGPLIAVGLTFGTALMMSFSVASQHGVINQEFFKLFPLVLLFAAINAWSEEMFTRFAIVAGLGDKLQPLTICWISALIFGVPHYFGTPSGVFGVIAAGFLGWLMAKSVIETRSMGWAWFIHFLQDVVIFGAGAMILAGNN